MNKLLLVAATVAAFATPALAGDVGVHVGPVGAGITTGRGPDYDRDRTAVREHEPRDRTTVIKKRNGYGDHSKTVIHHDND